MLIKLAVLTSLLVNYYFHKNAIFLGDSAQLHLCQQTADGRKATTNKCVDDEAKPQLNLSNKKCIRLNVTVVTVIK